MTDEEKQLKRAARMVSKSKHKYEFDDAEHKEMVNNICLKFYEGNFRFKPPFQSIIRFARTRPKYYQITNFLNDRVFHSSYNF
tara:strand:+ start:436 stop:684 length:249 start_codon:yes stop_codon:yes gene_type:complete